MSLSTVPGLITPGPADDARHAIGAFPVAGLFVAEGRRCRRRARTEFLRAVIGGVHHEGVVLEAELLRTCRESGPTWPSCSTMPSAIDTESRFAMRLSGLRCVHACACGWHSTKGRTACCAFAASVDVSAVLPFREFFVHRLHPLPVQRTGQLSMLLGTVGHSPTCEARRTCGILSSSSQGSLEVIRILRTPPLRSSDRAIQKTRRSRVRGGQVLESRSPR